uniref:Neur_chan_LBD domain-containing protein n=1 Tax=Heterorhabditis bacteriophora TaxID=37862 RepID=A0A1I7XDA7_HETBA
MRVPIALLTLLVTIYSFDTDCKWKSNVTDVEDIAHHKYQVLEECLFYKLTRDADQMQGKSNALMLLPPTVAAGETLDVQILHVGIRQMWMSWKDRRLRWDPAEWKTDTLNIKSFGRLWVPDINSDKHQTASQSADFVTFQSLQSNNNGNISGRLEFRIQAHCDIDYTEYPSDIKHCCFNLQSSLYKRYIKYYLENEDETLDVKDIKTNWHIMNSWIKKDTQEGDNKAELLEVCVVARRRSTTLAVELTLPVLISALLLLIAPFFRKIKVKMFALLLQFMSFQFMAEKTPQIGFGATVPKIYIFYAFTLGVTVISLIQTVIIAAMSRIKRKVPPGRKSSFLRLHLKNLLSIKTVFEFYLKIIAHRYTLLASVLNANLCCGSEEDPVTDGTSTKDASADWVQIHSAFNNLASCITMIVYVIGAITIAF